MIRYISLAFVGALMTLTAYLSNATVSILCLIQFSVFACSYGIPIFSKDGNSLFFSRSCCCALLLFFADFFGFWTLQLAGVVPLQASLFATPIISYALSFRFHQEWAMNLQPFSIAIYLFCAASIPIIVLFRNESNSYAIFTGFMIIIMKGASVVMMKITIEKTSEIQINSIKSTIYWFAAIISGQIDVYSMIKSPHPFDNTRLSYLALFALACIMHANLSKWIDKVTDAKPPFRIEHIVQAVFAYAWIWNIEYPITLIHYGILILMVGLGEELSRRESIVSALPLI